MGVLQLCAILAFLGVALYLFNRFVTWCDAGAKRIISFVVYAAMILLVLYAFGVLSWFHDVRIPAIR